jgi:hypothetical protein
MLGIRLKRLHSARQGVRTGSFAGALMLVLAPVVAPVIAQADPPQTGAQLSLSVSGNKLDDKLDSATSSDSLFGQIAGQGDGSDSDHSKQLDLGSVPFTVSAANSTDGWGAVASGTGQYVVPLSDSFSLINHGGFSKAQSLSGGLFGNTSVDAGPGLAYREGNLALALQPDIGVNVQSDALQQINYGLSTTVSKDLTSGLTATTTTGYTLQDATAGESRLANGSAALSYLLPDKVKLGLGYQMQQTLSSSDSSLSGQQGPMLSAEIPVTNSFNLGTNYAYVSSSTDTPGLDVAAKDHDTSQTFGLSAAWDIGAEINANVKLNANVNVTRQTQAGTDGAQLQKAGSVGMKMDF